MRKKVFNVRLLYFKDNSEFCEEETMVVCGSANIDLIKEILIDELDDHKDMHIVAIPDDNFPNGHPILVLRRDRKYGEM